MTKQPAIDYGATADAYAADKSDHNTDEEEEETSLEMGREEDEEEEEGASSSDEENFEEDEEAKIEIVHNPPPARSSTADEGEEPCSFDLRNLTAVNSHPLDERALYAAVKGKKSSDSNNPVTIETSKNVSEDYLLEKATQGCTQLLEALWQLPTERSDAGPMVTLPSYDVIPVPRKLPPPPPKQETRWEKFAKERGIPLNKEKRSRKVWDEATNSWKFRTGFDKANSKTGKDWPILEVGANDDPYADPWESRREEQNKQKEQNRQNQLKNQERAGVLPKGTTRRVMKSRQGARAVGKTGGNLPVGVPVDVTQGKLRGKESVTAALKHTQVSTASLGKFDKLREGEPERKHLTTQALKKKRKFVNNSGHSTGPGEQEKVSKVLQTVLQGGGVETEKARKKGKLAKGVTAYDYEYNDGTDSALFKKKKGRAASGKMRKMTKKRMK